MPTTSPKASSNSHLGFLAPLLLALLLPAALLAEDAPSDDDGALISEVSDEIVVLATRSEKRALEVPAHVTTIDFEDAVDDGFYAGADELRGQPGIFFRR
ncbi:MAG: hypothetical protein AAFY88_28930, partial [Acidobacteriota bacterium]